MSIFLPRLRQAIDVFPSPVEDQPGLLIRDPYHYTEDILIIPPVFVGALRFLDGRHTEDEVIAYLTQTIGRDFPRHPLHDFLRALDESGFLQTENFQLRKASKQKQFAEMAFREPSHAGSGYPTDTFELKNTLDAYLTTIVPPNPAAIRAIAAPHVSPFGGWQTYAAAYNRLRGIRDSLLDKTIVILGTSHYGEPEKFGFTRKPFKTPYGTVRTNAELVDRLVSKAGDAAVEEDYCHAIEHSIEFQVVFLQHLLGNRFQILPILCGAFHESFVSGRPPEADDRIRSFFDALGEIEATDREKLFWVLGIDLAHVGRRYGDDLDARANQGYMQEVREYDMARMATVTGGQPGEFFDLVAPSQDPLKWCGFSPLYTFLKTFPGERGHLLGYEQWNIDEASVVSFAAMEFSQS